LIPLPPPLSTLSLHDALPISRMSHTGHPNDGPHHSAEQGGPAMRPSRIVPITVVALLVVFVALVGTGAAQQCPKGKLRFYTSWRSEEHTSELQSRVDLVCRLL